MAKVIKNDKKSHTTRSDLATLHSGTASSEVKRIQARGDVIMIDIDAHWYFNWDQKKES